MKQKPDLIVVFGPLLGMAFLEVALFGMDFIFKSNSKLLWQCRTQMLFSHVGVKTLNKLLAKKSL